MLEHNKKTYRELENYILRHQSCCVVNPCGSGKTSVMSEFIKNHNSSKNVVLTKQKNADGYYNRMDNVFRNVTIRTYSSTFC